MGFETSFHGFVNETVQCNRAIVGRICWTLLKVSSKEGKSPELQIVFKPFKSIVNMANGISAKTVIGPKTVSNCIICFCSFYLFCSILEKDNFIEHLYIVLSY